MFYFLNYINIGFLNYMSNIFVIQQNNVDSESFFLSFMFIPQLLVVIFFIFLFISFYFSYYNNFSKEELTIDYDFLSSSATVESEKEIGAFDDVILILPILFIIFG
jgi:hypothetical protein